MRRNYTRYGIDPSQYRDSEAELSMDMEVMNEDEEQLASLGLAEAHEDKWARYNDMMNMRLQGYYA